MEISVSLKKKLFKIDKGEIPTARNPKEIHLYIPQDFFILKLYNNLSAKFQFLPEFYCAHDKNPMKRKNIHKT